jgi:Carboxypeptidase regulatory-like domain
VGLYCWRYRLSLRRFISVLAVIALTSSCSRAVPTASSPQKTVLPSIGIVSMSVTAETERSGARAYHVIVTLRESGGAPATITAIELAFMEGASLVASSRFDHPISEAANVCPANATIDSRELMLRDDDPSHPHATTVVARVSFTDGASTAGAISASADVPLSDAPAPVVFSLSGSVTDENTGRPVTGASVRVVDGSNSGMTSSTDGSGFYSIPDLAPGNFMVRATADRYDAREQSVALSQDTTIDLKLRPIAAPPAPAPPTPTPPPAAPCAYTVTPNAVSINWMGGTFSATLTRTSGTCSWQATSTAGWITLTGTTSGNGNATISYLVVNNGGVVASNTRFGGISITWSGGTAQVAVQQGGASPELCVFTIAVNGQSQVTVPSQGGQVAATVTWVNTGIPPSVCSATATAEAAWISFVPADPAPIFRASGGTLTLSIAPNPVPGSSRGTMVSIRSFTGIATLTITQR